MSRRAPDNMPTEAIRRFINTARRSRNEWGGQKDRLAAQLTFAERQHQHFTAKAAEYRQWLVTRELERLNG